MKVMNITFTDWEHRILLKAKDKSEANNWHDFILDLARGYLDNSRGKK